MKQIVTSCARVLQSVRLKQFIKAVLPPIIADRLKRRARPAPVDVEWEHLPAGWPDSTDRTDGGWNQLTLSETQRAKWKLFCDRVAGDAPLGIAHEATELSNVDVAENFANNMRLYEATGVGSLLLTDRKTNLSQIFTPGLEVATYDDPDDCAARIRFCLRHEEERRKVAIAGQDRTMDSHTYLDRMRQYVDLVSDLDG